MDTDHQNSTDLWQPGATRARLAARAHLLNDVRAFFSERGVLEVETPVLGRATVTEPAISSLFLAPEAASDAAGKPSPRWLQTSPEYHMKRLLAAGSGAIWQLSRCFRYGESGRLHNPEFSLLEWYRPGLNLHELINEVAELAHALLGRALPPTQTWQQLLDSSTGLNLAEASDQDLAKCATDKLGSLPPDLSRRDLLDLLYSAACANAGDTFVTEFPTDQAALAEIVPGSQGLPVAARFELVLSGLEVANGYQELTDPVAQRRRFEQDLHHRRPDPRRPVPRRPVPRRGAPAPGIDEALLAAMDHGLPSCCGVAVGFDRMVMLATGAESIDQVQAFSWPRA